MAYVDHPFSITDVDIMMKISYTVNNKPPIKEIALDIALLVTGTVNIVVGTLMAYNRVGGDKAHAPNVASGSNHSETLQRLAPSDGNEVKPETESPICEVVG